MTLIKNTASHPIGFTSSSEIKGYKPQIIETEIHRYPGKHLYSFRSNAFDNDFRYSEAIKNGNNEELICYLNSEGFNDVELIPLEEWIG